MLKRSSLLLLLAMLLDMSGYAQQTYLFVGSYNDAKEKDGIYVYSMDMQSGQLKPACTFAGMLNPSYLILSHDGQYIYACSETRTAGMGTVSSYAFDSKQQKIRFLSKQGSGGDNPVYLAIDKTGHWLVNGNYTGSSMAIHPLLADGGISPSVTVFYIKDSSITDRQKSAHIHSTVFSPDYKYVFATDLGADKIRRYRFDATADQALRADSFIRATPGSGPRHFTFHPNGQFAYCIEEMAGAISVYRYQDGRLDSLQRIPTHDDRPRSYYNSADIHISPDGLFLYASNRGEENNIAIYRIQPDGRLTFVAYQSTLGDHPRNFLIDPTGQFLIVANQISGDVIVFRRNKQTGLLTYTGVRVQMTGPSSLQIKTYTN